MQVLKKELGPQHAYITSMSENGDVDYDKLTRMVYIPSAEEAPLDVLHNGLRLIQKALSVGDSAPEVWFVLRATQARRRVVQHLFSPFIYPLYILSRGPYTPI